MAGWLGGWVTTLPALPLLVTNSVNTQLLPWLPSALPAVRSAHVPWYLLLTLLLHLDVVELVEKS